MGLAAPGNRLNSDLANDRWSDLLAATNFLSQIR